MAPDPLSPFADPPAPPPRRVAPPRQPSAFSAIDWDAIRIKAWQSALIVASAYVVSHPERWGWIAPVLTAAAGMSKAPGGKSP